MIFCEGLKTSVVGKAAIQVRSTILDVLFIYTLQAKLMMLYSGYALAEPSFAVWSVSSNIVQEIFYPNYQNCTIYQQPRRMEIKNVKIAKA